MFVQKERQQIENLKLLHKKEITHKEDSIKQLQEKSTFEENKKIVDIQIQFDKKMKSRFDLNFSI